MATQFAVDLIFKSQGLNKLDNATNKLKGISAQTKGAQAGLKGVGGASKTAAAGVNTLGVAFAKVLAPIAAVTAAVSFFGKALAVSSEREADVRALADSLGRMGKTSEDLKLLQEQADKFGDTTLFNQEDFTKAAKNLTSFTDIALKDYDRIIKASADIATKTGGDVKEASLQVAKALNAPTQNLSALSRSGIQFSETQKEVIKRLEATGKKAEAQRLILAELEKQYGGAAKAAAGGFAGSVDTLGEKFRDFQEGVGKIAQGVLKPFVDGLAALFGAIARVQPAFQAFLGGLGKIAGAFAPIGEALFGNIDVLKVWGDALIFAYKIAAVVANDVAYVIKQMATQVAKVIKAISSFIGNALGAINRALGGFFGDAASSSATGMKAIVENVANGIRKIQQLISGLINATSYGFVAKMFGFDLGKWATDGLGALADGIEGGWNYLSGVVSRARSLELPDFSVNGNGNGINSALDGNGSGSSGGGKGGAGRESNVPALERELLLKQQLFAIEQQIAAAQLIDDKNTVIRLQGEQKLLQLKDKIAAVEADKKLPAAEKALKVAILEQQATEARFDTSSKLESIESDRKERLDDLLTGFDREIELAQAKSEEAEKLLKIEHDIVDLKKEGLLTTEAEVQAYRDRAQAAAQAGGGGKLQKYMQQLQADLSDTEGMIVSLAGTVESEIGSAMSNAITGLIDGTQTAQEAFSNMFKNIGKAFIDMATQMIAKALVMKALGILTGGGGGGGFTPTGGWGNFGSIQFAEGGFVTGPTNALIGEAGESEYVIPASKMSGAMQRYSAGARGDSVIPADGSSAGGDGGAMGGGTVVNYNGPTLNFNSEDYVPMSAVSGIIDAAASKGAKQGQARTMNSLKNSRSQRSKIGI